MNEIESVNAEIEGQEFDKQKTKRKKDGVFYTPKYITKYIVDNTVGKLCNEKKTELGVIETEYQKSRKGRNKDTIKTLKTNLDNYRNWLLEITILDPACGSGAFLNQALDFLIKEHTYIDELETSLFGSSMVFQNIENTILEKNIFGVDLNEESVEIAKLSLWLRTAQPRRKLNTLNNNIKCGNSLIDDPKIAGDKAFNWQNEFPHVLDNGGFDVVIGNPPYVRVQSLKEHYFEQTLYLESKYLSATGKYDLYALFMEKCYHIINNNGIVSFILPHKFLVADFGVGIRKFFIENKSVESILHFGSVIVFNDASTYTCIINLKKTNQVVRYSSLNPIKILEPFNLDEISYNNLDVDSWQLKSKIELNLLNKIKSYSQLKDICKGIYQGLITTGDDIFMLEGKIEGDLFTGYSKALKRDVTIESSLLKEVLKGQDIKRYLPLKSNKYVIYPHKLNDKLKTTPIELDEMSSIYPLTEKYLLHFKDDLIAKKIRYKTNPTYWYSLHRSREIALFEQDYIITPQLQNNPSFTIKETDVYADAGGYLLLPKEEFSVKSLLPILNSKIMWYFIKNTSSEYGGGYFYFKTKYLEPFSIPIERLSNIDFSSKMTIQLTQTKEYYSLSLKFTTYLQSQFSIEKLTKKLQNWHELAFGEFIKEVNKAIKKENKERAKAEQTPIATLSKTDEMDWMDVFETKKAEAQTLKAQIDKTDSEINQMVYELYELTAEEIEIIENSTK